MKDNFTFSKHWIESVYIRYSKSNVKKIGNLYFHENNNILKCLNYFTFNVSNNNIERFKDIIENKKIKFSYIDKESSFLQNMKIFCEKNKYEIKDIDSWDAPILETNYSLEDYLKKDGNTRIKRSYNGYLKNRDKFKFVLSDANNNLELWNDALNIDNNSWKKEENSDMRSLEREDLQYELFIQHNNELSSLVVAYFDSIPFAYSLMFKNEENNYWFAVKWGASNLGRKIYAGIYCLFYHLEYIYIRENKLEIDFWGRRNLFYDLLKNKHKERCHIEISRKE